MTPLQLAAMKTLHSLGITWYHPVTGKAFPPPKQTKKKSKRKKP